MRLVAILLSMPFLLGATFLAPWVGLCTLAVLYYMRPEIWQAPAWFSLVEIFTWATMAGLLLGMLRGRLAVRWSGLQVLMFLLVAWSWISASNATLSRTMGTDRALLYLKCAVAGFLISQLLDNVDRLNRFLWAVVIGTAWTVKSAIFLLLTKNPDRVNNIGGQGGGANYLALILVITMPILLYQLQGGRKKEKLLALSLLPLWLLSMGLSGSRGGFLAMGVEIFAFIWLNKRKGLALTLVGFAGLLFVLLAPAHYFDRMETIQTYEQDDSAMSRIQLWKGAWSLAHRYPVFGVGPENYRLHSSRFTAHRDADQTSGLVAHSLYMQTLAELGWPGGLLLVAVMAGTFASLVGAGRRAPDTVEGRRLKLYCRAMGVAFLGFAAHSIVMSNLHRDFFWWFIGLAGAAPAIARRLADGAEALVPRPRTARRGFVPASAWAEGSTA